MEKLNYLKKVLKFCVALLLVVLSVIASMAQRITTNTRAAQNGYEHEFWSQGGQGNSYMELGTDARFNAQWSGITNYLARRGLGFTDMKFPHWRLGAFTATYAVDYKPTCSVANSNSYMGVYGWTLDPSDTDPASKGLVEWYIIEKWCNWIPSKDATAQSFGTINVNGSNYEIIRTKKTNAPSIRMTNGGDNFYQYFSIRQNSEGTGTVSGTVDVTQHFFAWEKAGLKLGNLYEVSMLVEGYAQNGNGAGSANFSALTVTKSDERVLFHEDSYQVAAGTGTFVSLDAITASGNYPDITLKSLNTNIVKTSGVASRQAVTGVAQGNARVQIIAPDGTTVWDEVTVVVTPAVAPLIITAYEFRAYGTKGDERVRVLLDGVPTNSGHTMSTSYQTYTGKVYGNGEVSIEFINDDGLATNGRDVRVDYISMNGVKRETEQMPVNTAAYNNGVCGGIKSDWLNCNGKVNYGATQLNHTITIRARGNAGGEHIDLLIDKKAINGGWTLGTAFKEYTATVSGDGDINVEFDNDGGSRDAVIDWVKIDNQVPRYAAKMQYNTGVSVNGKCGGSYSQWLHCNGVIGFGKVSDNFNPGVTARAIVSEAASVSSVESKESDINIYPNPSAGSISIKLDDAVHNNTSVKIYDAGGKGIVYSRDNIHERVIEITGLANGLYIVSVKSNGRVQRKKLSVIQQ